jgi:hypothetical protein
VSQVEGFIKGKSAIHLARVYGERKRNFVGQPARVGFRNPTIPTRFAMKTPCIIEGGADRRHGVRAWQRLVHRCHYGNTTAAAMFQENKKASRR